MTQTERRCQQSATIREYSSVANVSSVVIHHRWRQFRLRPLPLVYMLLLTYPLALLLLLPLGMSLTVHPDCVCCWEGVHSGNYVSVTGYLGVRRGTLG